MSSKENASLTESLPTAMAEWIAWFRQSSRQRVYLGIAVIAIIAGITAKLSIDSLYPSDLFQITTNPTTLPSDDSNSSQTSAISSIVDIVKALYEPLKIPIDARTFESIDGVKYKLPDKDPIWTVPLGKRVCIVDIDNRPFDGPNELLNPGPTLWRKLHNYGNGALNHYLYAMIHGYTYHFIHVEGFTDRWGTWNKIPPINKLLRADKCHLLVVCDADAVFMNLHLPLEWLLNRWEYQRNTSVAVANDPWEEPQNFDSKGRNTINTGFMIAQNLPRTRELFEELENCPYNTEKYPGCDKFLYQHPHEQAAYYEYMRYEFADSVMEIPCAEANGYPKANLPHCDGQFIRHSWRDKWLARQELEQSLTANFMARVHSEFLRTKDNVVIDL